MAVVNQRLVQLEQENAALLAKYEESEREKAALKAEIEELRKLGNESNQSENLGIPSSSKDGSDRSVPSPLGNEGGGDGGSSGSLGGSVAVSSLAEDEGKSNLNLVTNGSIKNEGKSNLNLVTYGSIKDEGKFNLNLVTYGSYFPINFTLSSPYARMFSQFMVW